LIPVEKGEKKGDGDPIKGVYAGSQVTSKRKPIGIGEIGWVEDGWVSRGGVVRLARGGKGRSANGREKKKRPWYHDQGTKGQKELGAGAATNVGRRGGEEEYSRITAFEKKGSARERGGKKSALFNKKAKRFCNIKINDRKRVGRKFRKHFNWGEDGKGLLHGGLESSV